MKFSPFVYKALYASEQHVAEGFITCDKGENNTFHSL